MFAKKKESLRFLPTDDGILEMNLATYDYIRKLKSEIVNIKYEKSRVEAELKVIKPVIEHTQYAPAMSSDCGECKFVVLSRWNGDIIGCRKSGVCEDFALKEEE